IEIMAPDREAAEAMARRLSAQPQVARTMTLNSLVPGEQDEKLKLIQAAAGSVEASLSPAEIAALPTDAENVEALSSTADALSAAAGEHQRPGAAAARRLSGLLSELAKSDAAARQRVEAAIAGPLRFSLAQLRKELKPQRITPDSIPADLKRQWVTPDGAA